MDLTIILSIICLGLLIALILLLKMAVKFTRIHNETKDELRKSMLREKQIEKKNNDLQVELKMSVDDNDRLRAELNELRKKTSINATVVNNTVFAKSETEKENDNENNA